MGQVYRLQCAKCASVIETVTVPETQVFLCNSCWMSWKDIKDKLTGHAYMAEAQKAFYKWVNDVTRRHSK